MPSIYAAPGQVGRVLQLYTAANLSDSVHEIADIRGRYIRERLAFVPGDRMSEILSDLGATPADIEALEIVSDHLGVDPTLPFRESRNGRFYLDSAKRQGGRLEFQPFILSAEEDFVRHDSGQVRRFDEVEEELQANPAFQALLRFQYAIIDGVTTSERPGLDYSSDKWICTLFNLRTITTPALVGEPALEGVHSDGVDHTMTTFLGAQNMTDDSAVTYVHDPAERNSIRWDQTDPSLVVGNWQHTHFLDTLLIADNERKHSLSPLRAEDPARRATRDMLIFFTRRPAAEGHVSYPYDSLNHHQSLPLSFDLSMST